MIDIYFEMHFDLNFYVWKELRYYNYERELKNKQQKTTTTTTNCVCIKKLQIM